MNVKIEQIEKLKTMLSPDQLKIFMDIIRGYNTEIDDLNYQIRILEADLERDYNY